MPLQLMPIILLAGAGALLFSKRGRVKCSHGIHGGVLHGIRYKEIVTKGADPDGELPMIIVFHGRGASADDMIPFMATFKEKARIILPDGIIENNGHYAWFETKAKSEDQDKLSDEIEFAVNQVSDFVRDINKCRPTKGKPYVAGHSQGGIMSYALGTMRPELISGSFPASGWLPEKLWSPDTGWILAVHGRADQTVPFERTADYVAKMHQLGADKIFLRETSGAHGLSGELLFRWHDAMKYAIREGIQNVY